jgi:hypothetical protein
LLTLGVLALPAAALAQDDAPEAEPVQVNGFAFTPNEVVGLNVQSNQFEGDDPDADFPGGPQPPYLLVSLYTDDPDARPTAMYVYDAAAFETYTQAGEQFTALQALLEERPDAETLAGDPDEPRMLPYLPVLPVSQALLGQIDYIETEALSGIRYVTVLRSDVSPFIASEFLYTFQGISSDGDTYLSLVAPLDVALFPERIDPAAFDYNAFSEGFADYLTESQAALNEADDDAFTPPLAALDAVIESIAFS